ncbi:MAG: small-conductance mechanosensitive channel [Flavobacteriales bacterium]|jgi:small-conductance mechanosensitive channel
MKEILEQLSSEGIKTIFLILGLFIVRMISAQAVRKVMSRLEFGFQRKRMTLKIINMLLLTIAVIISLGIWGLKGTDLFVFATSVVTVIGIAFFAQWSILSNLSSGLLLFFSHPLKIGDYIDIKDKELSVFGRVDDISMFFIHIITTDGERVTVPNNIILQKTVGYSKSAKEVEKVTNTHKIQKDAE